MFERTIDPPKIRISVYMCLKKENNGQRVFVVVWFIFMEFIPTILRVKRKKKVEIRVHSWHHRSKNTTVIMLVRCSKTKDKRGAGGFDCGANEIDRMDFYLLLSRSVAEGPCVYQLEYISDKKP
jgi:hypothetical protein